MTSNSRLSHPALMLFLLLAACSGEQPPVDTENGSGDFLSTRDVADSMLATMGGLDALRAVESIVMVGNGTRNRLGQIPETGGIDPDATLTGETETIDFANGRAAFDNGVNIGDEFSQHRTEALTTWNGVKIGWGTTEGRPNEASSVNGLFSWAAQNTPAMLLRRNVITAAIAADDVNPQQPARSIIFNGRPHWAIDTVLDGEALTLMVDQSSRLLGGFTALDTETMLGDVMAEYRFSDYRPVGDLMLPFANVILKDGQPYSAMNYTDIRLNDISALAIFDIPEEIHDQADQAAALGGASWVPLQWNTVSDRVTHVVAFSHHSMVVEFPSFVVVIEGPYTEGQSLTLARMIEERIGKPIRYVVPTHPHFDHTGGLRGLASVGASVLTAAGHEAEIRGIVESPHTNPPDALALAADNGAEIGQVEVFTGATEITEENQTLQLFEVNNFDHVKPKVLAFVPGDGVIFQSDMFFGAPGPDATNLDQAIRELGLRVRQIVGGHGGVFPYSALTAAVGNN